MTISETISKSIKEGKWLDIAYKHSDTETTYFWFAINDIDIKRKMLIGDIFNQTKSFDSLQGKISFEKIISAKTLFFTSYDVPQDLINKLENIDPSKIEWLDYDKFNSNILNYYQECSLLDSDPYQKDYYMIDGVDLSILRKEKNYKLNENQQKTLIDKIYHNKDFNNAYKELIISVLSISNGNNKYVVCYYPLTYNPKDKSLIVSDRLLFNKSFLINGKKNSLYKYVDTDMEEFITNFKTNYNESKEEITSHLSRGEMIDTRPDIMLLQHDNPVNLEDTYKEIERQYSSKELSRPLQAFFGNLTRKKGILKKVSLVIYDKKVNIDQMRVLYNSMTQNVTYVQGPPGTGKTQTILNVILCNFVENRTMLISSSNNNPVDGIMQKLSFEYKDKEVMFPYLRLGNINEVIKSTDKIIKLYNYSSKLKPDEKLINKILENNDKNNEILRNKLKDYEKRLDLIELIESGNKLISSFENKNSELIRKIKQKVEENKEKLDSIPYVSDEEVLSLFKPISNDIHFLSYLYFQSLKYVSKLKLPRYSKLIEICQITDDDERVKEFNKWIKEDDNMKLLSQVFPVILTTNISSVRLGSPKYKFDLVILDEAGQCNVAQSLIPVSKANNLLLVGDINQLRPVILLENSVNDKLIEKYNIDKSYSYKGNSILSIMKNHDSVSKNILLSYHYRCGKNIINFSNKRYYKSELKIDDILNNGDLTFIDVKNNNYSNNKNENFDECIGIVNYIKKNNVKDATIITPFVNQEKLMNQLLERNGIKDVNCGTIHSLQGAEKDTIIFSTSISPRTSKITFDWLKNNSELINVGITRAKKKLIVVSDYEALNRLSDKNDDLYSLVQYVKNKGEYLVTPSINSISIGKSNNSKAEDEFYKTISQFCSTNKNFEAERNVSFSKIFENDPILSKTKYEFDLVLYEKHIFSRKVAIVIEINGGEHFGIKSREKSDQLKREICAKNNWKFISIPNTFVKSYEEIREIILSTKGEEYKQMTLFDL